MSQVMIIIREFLWQQADLTSAMQSVNLEPVVIGWVDDLAIPLLSTNAEALSIPSKRSRKVWCVSCGKLDSRSISEKGRPNVSLHFEAAKLQLSDHRHL